MEELSVQFSLWPIANPFVFGSLLPSGAVVTQWYTRESTILGILHYGEEKECTCIDHCAGQFFLNPIWLEALKYHMSNTNFKLLRKNGMLTEKRYFCTEPWDCLNLPRRCSHEGEKKNKAGCLPTTGISITGCKRCHRDSSVPSISLSCQWYFEYCYHSQHQTQSDRAPPSVFAFGSVWEM